MKLAGLGQGMDTTSSLLEFHRLNSPYIMSGVTTARRRLSSVRMARRSCRPARLSPRWWLRSSGWATRRARTSHRTRWGGDRCCRRHQSPSARGGVLQVRSELTRSRDLPGEDRRPTASPSGTTPRSSKRRGVGRADSGGVKFDRVLPKPKRRRSGRQGGLWERPVPSHGVHCQGDHLILQPRPRPTPRVRAADEATELLVVLSLWKVRMFLESSCDCGRRASWSWSTARNRSSPNGRKGFSLPTAVDLASKLATDPRMQEPIRGTRGDGVHLDRGKKKGAGEREIELPADFATCTVR